MALNGLVVGMANCTLNSDLDFLSPCFNAVLSADATEKLCSSTVETIERHSRQFEGIFQALTESSAITAFLSFSSRCDQTLNAFAQMAHGIADDRTSQCLHSLSTCILSSCVLKTFSLKNKDGEEDGVLNGDSVKHENDNNVKHENDNDNDDVSPSTCASAFVDLDLCFHQTSHLFLKCWSYLDLDC